MSGADMEYRAHTEARADATAMELRIAAQPLDQALQEFARQSGMQVVFFSNVTHGIQSPGVTGKYTVDSALRQLLAGSGLSYRLIDEGTVEIRKAGAP